eukprot:172751-Pelagomonas_calceolata.AAC.3
MSRSNEKFSTCKQAYLCFKSRLQQVQSKKNGGLDPRVPAVQSPWPPSKGLQGVELLDGP